MNSELTSTETWSLLSLTIACFGILANTFRGDGEPLIASLAMSGIAFSSTYAMIRWCAPSFLEKGLKGKDLSKVHKKEIPEMIGAISSIVHIFTMICFIVFPFYKDIVAATSGGGNRDVVFELQTVETGRLLHRFPHNKLASYGFGLVSLFAMLVLGVTDDYFDLRWRQKFFLPAFASLPMLFVYYVDFGVTHVVVPKLLQPYVGTLWNLGPWYYVYMAAISIFCPNSINIVAGINGIEVGQSIVIALLIILNDCLYLFAAYPHPATDSHLFSLYMLLPFLGVSLAIWSYNKYPAQVFVGDTYCYYAGIVFAIVGILGHFSKTLLLLFIPQIFNFLFSVPQLIKIIPCPRHRMPHFNARTGLLEPSMTNWMAEKNTLPNAHQFLLLETLRVLRLIKVERNEEGKIVKNSNFTILNLWLVWRGPMREDRLTNELMAFQMAVGLLGLFVRHKMALLIFDADNLSV